MSNRNKSKESINYRTERVFKTIAVSDYLADYVNVPRFIEYCRKCGNYNTVWSCPEYDFDPVDLWNEYKTLDLELIKISFDKSAINKQYTKDEIVDIAIRTLRPEKRKMMIDFMAKEKEIPGSLSLSAGSCDFCMDDIADKNNNCAREVGGSCRHPEKLRYSIESLGGDVTKTAKDLFGIELQWSEGTALPEYFILMCGLLRR